MTEFVSVPSYISWCRRIQDRALLVFCSSFKGPSTEVKSCSVLFNQMTRNRQHFRYTQKWHEMQKGKAISLQERNVTQVLQVFNRYKIQNTLFFFFAKLRISLMVLTEKGVTGIKAYSHRQSRSLQLCLVLYINTIGKNKEQSSRRHGHQKNKKNAGSI